MREKDYKKFQSFFSKLEKELGTEVLYINEEVSLRTSEYYFSFLYESFQNGLLYQQGWGDFFILQSENIPLKVMITLENKKPDSL